MTTTTHRCTNYLCENDTDRPDTMCGPCRASRELLDTVRDAMLKFLDDRFPVPSAVRKQLCDSENLVPEIFDYNSRVRREISEANSEMAMGLIRLLELVLGKRVYMTGPPCPDPHGPGLWYGAFGWDISEDQRTVEGADR